MIPSFSGSVHGGPAPGPPAFTRHSSDVPRAGRQFHFGVKLGSRVKRKQALLASNLPRDIPASDAPKACQALVWELPARAVFFVGSLGTSETCLKKCRCLGKSPSQRQK